MDTNQILLKGNCLELLDSIDTNKINLVIADLPYGQTDNDWDVKIDLQELWKQLKRVCTNNCAYIFFTTTRFGYDLIASNPNWFRYDLVWNKDKPTGFLTSKKQPMRGHEMIYVFYNKQPIYNIEKNHNKIVNYKSAKPYNSNCYNNEKLKQTRTVYEPRLPQSVLDFATINNKQKRFHPTEKPNDLLEWLIKYYSNEGDTVLDPTCGAGGTLLACKNLNRNCYGIEMNETYYNTAKNRLDTFSKFKELID
jgi:DNA modification methylase